MSKLVSPRMWLDEGMVPGRGPDRPGFSLPVGTVTFLLTDIEGSTRQWETAGAVMGAAVARHYELLDRAVSAHHGVRPLEQGEGDSVVAAFSRASDAAAAALDAQRSLTAEAWPEGAGLRVRMALHTGEAELRDEGNYFGPAVIRCARLRAIGHGGQVLCSGPTADLIADRLPVGAALRDLGSHRLRDLGRPERVFELMHAELAGGFGPLASLDALPNNLPVQLTSFVGRAAELAELRDLLAGTRLLTLNGVGGCGKTRTALQLAADVVDQCPGGVWLVELAPVTDPDRVAATIAAALGERDLAGDIVEVIVGRIGDDTTLVVLDNCEHLLGPVAQLADTLLRRCPGLAVVATSREPLGVPGESAWRIPSLSLPERAEPIEPDTLTKYDAVRLFLDRAARSRANFALNAANAPAVAQICARLDGIPLAIELAAARVRAMTVEAVATGLDDRFRLLTGGARTVLPRQQTLQASIDWGYALLDETERAAFRRLGVFAGGFTLDAAEAVVAGDDLPAVEVLNVVLALVDKSMVDANDTGHYRLLETLRQYAFAKLDDCGEVASLRDHHLEYYASRAAEAGRGLEGRDAIRVFADLDLDVDNFRAASDWAMQSDRAEDAWRLATALWLFWQRDRAAEGVTRLVAALETPGGDPLGRAKAVLALGDLSFYCGDFAGANDYGAQSLLLAEASGDARTIGRVNGGIGVMGVFMQDLDAVDLLERALVLHRSTNDTYFWVDSLIGLVLAGWFTGDAELTKRSADEALQVGRANGNPTSLSRALVSGVMAACARGDLDEWETCAEEAIAICLDLRDEIYGPFALGYLARHRALRGRYDDALEAADSALSSAQPVNNVQGLAIASWAKATAERDAGRDTALETLAQAHAIAMDAGLTPLAAECAAAMAVLFIADSNLAAARKSVHITSGLAEGHYGQGARGWALQAAGELALAEDNVEEAIAAVHEALTAWTEIGNRLGVVTALELLVRLNVHTNQNLEAARLLGAVTSERDRLGWPVAPADRPRRAADWAALEAAMGGEAFAAAYGEGVAMDAKEVVAYARRGRGKRRKTTSGWSSLTATELEVVRLAADGMRNAEIAERLFMASETVKSHLRHIFAKLGVTNRAELASYAIPRLANPR